jgi:hypothetical protein
MQPILTTGLAGTQAQFKPLTHVTRAAYAVDVTRFFITFWEQ